MAQSKIKIIMDLTQEESDRLDAIVKARGTTKIGFLRQAIEEAEKRLEDE